MPEEQAPQIRIRVSVGRTSKGLPSYDCTVELVHTWEDTDLNARDMAEALAAIVLSESHRVENILKARYGQEWQET